MGGFCDAVAKVAISTVGRTFIKQILEFGYAVVLFILCSPKVYKSTLLFR